MDTPLFQPSMQNTSRGFTLVELMVSLSLFTVVVLASVGAVFAINNAAHQVDAMRSVLDNLNFAVDSMTRTIHTAEAVSCGGSGSIDSPRNCLFSTDPNRGSKVLTVKSTIGLPVGQSEIITYSLERNSVTKNTEIIKTVNGSSVAITAPEINIDKLVFYVSGATKDDHEEPAVTFMVKGVASVGNDTAPFALQSFISVRAIE